MSKSKDTALAFQRKKYPHLTDEEFRFMVQQQEGRERLRDKLPTLVQQPDWWFPPRLACEQCSSERTATYKAELIRPHYTPSLSLSLSGVPASNAQWGGFREGRGGSSPSLSREWQGGSFIDLTGGYGIDSFYLSAMATEAHYVEQNPELCRIAEHNFSRTRPHLQVHNTTAEEFLRTLPDIPNTKQSEVHNTKFPTRSEAKFLTQSSLHGAQRSSQHEVPNTERSEVHNTKFPTRSEAKFLTQSSQHEAKRSSQHEVPNTEQSEVPYTKFPTRSEAEFLTQSSQHEAKRSSQHEVPNTERSEVTCIYLDPARRDNHGGKVFRIEDCTPNIIDLLPLLQQKSTVLMIKLSPMLDITAALRSLGEGWQVHVVAVRNEVKELLFIKSWRGSDGLGGSYLTAANYTQDHWQTLSFTLEEEQNAQVNYWHSTDAPRYLYEPNAAILKAAAFRFVSEHFRLAKLAPSTHLYAADHLLTDFPGRVWEVVSPLTSSILKHLPDTIRERGASILTRNYPLSADQLRKKLKLKDSTEQTIIAARIADKPMLFWAKKG